MGATSNRRPPERDRFILKAFRAAMGPIRAWLFYHGHEEAARALAGVTYEDVQDAMDLVKDEIGPRLTPERDQQLVEAIMKDLPPDPGSILPTLAEAREANALDVAQRGRAALVDREGAQ